MISARSAFARVIAAIVLLCGVASVHAQPAPSASIYQDLKKLNELGRVLMIAAHPDDERTEVLAYFARGRDMRAAYLSLTRGEGGQNLLGSEQGAALGLIRTEELLAARRIDGAEQFFTRAIDFGFSKTADETIRKWGHDLVVSDIVWVIRRFRPDVVILGFSGTPADGHGHHQASAILGKEACDIAGDPTKFPEQLKYVQPWKPTKLVTAPGFGGRGGATGGMAPVAQINTSGYDALDGYSYQQIATLSRSQHRSQGLGASGIGGGMGGGRGTAANTAAGAPDLFDGIDHSWNRVQGGAAIGALLSQAVREFDFEHPDKVIPLLGRARTLIAAVPKPLGEEKLAAIDELIARCAAVWADAQVQQGDAIPGSHVKVALTVTPREPVPVSVQSVRAEGLWRGAASNENQADGRLPDYDLQVPAGQPYSQPFWLAKPHGPTSYEIDNQLLIGVPDPIVEEVRIALTVEGIPIEIARPIMYRYNDRLEGEKARPLAIVPEVSVNFPLAPDLSANVAMFPNSAARSFQVTLRSNIENASGTFRLQAPEGWSVQPSETPFEMAEAGDQKDISFRITPPTGTQTAELRGVARVGNREISSGMAIISYSHIPQEILFPDSEAKAERSDIKLTARRVGYIMGAGDEVPQSLGEIGAEVTLLGEEDLRKGDLSRFDAIVAGVRSYNVRPDLRKYQQRLMDYVSNGGSYVVQYQSAGATNFGPYPIGIPGGNGYRVTVEDAPVRFTHPDSPLLQNPNRITDKDFEGWVQERGLLFPTEWDPRYNTLLSSNDPGEKPLDGGVLWTRYGKGIYIFTCYDWFRELPAGVAGAYRTFANFLSAK
jgi:LmbE family N-acetylglucosaminyl deacetylase